MCAYEFVYVLIVYYDIYEKNTNIYTHVHTKELSLKILVEKLFSEMMYINSVLESDLMFFLTIPINLESDFYLLLTSYNRIM